MRTSKWIAVLFRFPWSLALILVSTLFVMIFEYSPWIPILCSIILILIKLPKEWPRQMDAAKWEAVMGQPVVHFTTFAQAQEMAHEGARLPGGKPGWVHIRPSAGWLDALGFGDRKAAYAFSGLPDPKVWIQNVGKKATAAILIDPSDLREVMYRSSDGALMILGGYHGPAEIWTVQLNMKDKCLILKSCDYPWNTEMDSQPSMA